MVTDWAYQQACAAIQKHRARADALAAELAELRQEVEQNNSFLREACRSRRCAGGDCWNVGKNHECETCYRVFVIDETWQAPVQSQHPTPEQTEEHPLCRIDRLERGEPNSRHFCAHCGLGPCKRHGTLEHPISRMIIRWEGIEKPVEPRSEPCKHPNIPKPEFDKDLADRENLSASEIRRRWPRVEATCPDCETAVISYASKAHYVYGDW